MTWKSPCISEKSLPCIGPGVESVILERITCVGHIQRECVGQKNQNWLDLPEKTCRGGSLFWRYPMCPSSSALRLPGRLEQGLPFLHATCRVMQQGEEVSMSESSLYLHYKRL